MTISLIVFIPVYLGLAKPGSSCRNGRRYDTAAAALAETKQLQPDLSVEWVEKHHPIVRSEDRAIYIEGLRAAGLK